MSEMHAQLQMGDTPFRKQTSQTILSIRGTVQAIGYSEFRRVCRKNAAFIVALTQAERDARKVDPERDWIDN